MKTIKSYFSLVFKVNDFTQNSIVLEWTMHPLHPLGIYNLIGDSEASLQQPLRLGRYDNTIII